MNQEIVAERLTSALSRLSPRQRDRLAMILEDPNASIAFRRLIETALELYNGGDNRTLYGFGPRTKRRTKDVVTSGLEDDDSLRHSFATILWDKTTFPNTAALIRAVNHFFNIDLESQRFIKAGRKKTIAEGWRRVLALPRPERVTRLRRFFHEFASLLDPQRSYRELFRILSRSD